MAREIGFGRKDFSSGEPSFLIIKFSRVVCFLNFGVCTTCCFLRSFLGKEDFLLSETERCTLLISDFLLKFSFFLFSEKVFLGFSGWGFYLIFTKVLILQEKSSFLPLSLNFRYFFKMSFFDFVFRKIGRNDLFFLKIGGVVNLFVIFDTVFCFVFPNFFEKFLDFLVRPFCWSFELKGLPRTWYSTIRCNCTLNLGSSINVSPSALDKDNLSFLDTW